MTQKHKFSPPPQEYLKFYPLISELSVKIKVAKSISATGIGKTAYHSAIAKLDKAGLLPDWFEEVGNEN